MYVCYGQEIMLHNLPLTLLVIYNNTIMDKSFALDRALIAFSLFHMISVAIEFLYFRF
jgi:hypothetical protein